MLILLHVNDINVSCDLSFLSWIKVWQLLKFREHFYSRVLNLAFVLQSRKKRDLRPAKLRTNKV